MITKRKIYYCRYLLVYKFGGIYLDLDFVTLNDLSHYRDFVVTEPPILVCGGALGFRNVLSIKLIPRSVRT